MNEKLKQSANLKSYKIIIIGAGAVGKSALVIQFIKSHFIYDYDPTIEDSYVRQIKIDDELVRLSILDTAGFVPDNVCLKYRIQQEEFRAMRDQYLRTGDGFLLVFSVCDRASFDEIFKLRKQILRSKDVDSFPMLIIANKCDLDDEDKRVISNEELESVSKELNIPYLESSAKLKTNVETAFTDLVRLVREYQLKQRPPITPIKQKKKRCCIL